MSDAFNVYPYEPGAPLAMIRQCYLPGKKIRVGMIAECRRHLADGYAIRCALMRDRRGNYYAGRYEFRGENNSELVQIVEGKTAMRWFIENWIDCPHLAEQFRRAIENPSFHFLPLVARRPKTKKPKAKKKAAPAAGFAVQLEMATALVSVTQKLATDASAEALAEARRRVAVLHQSLHAEDALRAVNA